MHRQRAHRNNGDPLGVRNYRGEALTYFLTHVDDYTEDCLPWPYKTDPTGYGHVWLEGRWARVHILACVHHYGPMPAPKMMVLHQPVICHNRSCFNWRHLRWGTNQENTIDKVRDETIPTGERCYNARLTRSKVTEIRTRHTAGGISMRTLAIEYGVTHSVISGILSGQMWKDS